MRTNSYFFIAKFIEEIFVAHGGGGGHCGKFAMNWAAIQCDMDFPQGEF
jgi:hypothetical protein